MTKGRYVVAVNGVAIFLTVSDGQIYSCKGYRPTDASWRRLTKLTNRYMGQAKPDYAVWVMPRK